VNERCNIPAGYLDIRTYIHTTRTDSGNYSIPRMAQINTLAVRGSQAVDRVADRTASQQTIQ